MNVANLMLVRGSARERELALRAAIGAGRARLLRLLLTESVLLAVLGGALGVLAAWWGVRALVALSGHYLPRAADIRLDGWVLGFALLVSLLTGALFGLWPALRASAGTGSAGTLREDTRGSVGSGGANRARALLVMTEVALAVVLVVGAGLMVRSFQRLTSADPGFRPENVLLLRFTMPDPPASAPPSARTEQRMAYVQRVAQVPGVVAVGATKIAPLTGGRGESHPFDGTRTAGADAGRGAPGAAAAGHAGLPEGDGDPVDRRPGHRCDVGRQRIGAGGGRSAGRWRSASGAASRPWGSRSPSPPSRCA